MHLATAIIQTLATVTDKKDVIVAKQVKYGISIMYEVRTNIEHSTELTFSTCYVRFSTISNCLAQKVFIKFRGNKDLTISIV